MEFVEGITLREELGREPMGVARACLLADDIAAAIARAHRCGIVHRDLKPENVIVTPEGHAKILDFGLARAIDEESRRGAPGGVEGTRHYMSPEQAAGNPTDARTDVFSFGVLLYELLAGRRPFEARAERDPKKWTARDWAASARLRELAPRVPVGLERVVERCLETEPAKRFADGSELLAALRSVGRPRRLRWAYWLSAALVVSAASAAAAAASYRAHARGSSGAAGVEKPDKPATPRATLRVAGQLWEIVDGEWLAEGDDLVGRAGHAQTVGEVADATIQLDAWMPTSIGATVGVGFRYSLAGDDPMAQCGYGFNFRPTGESATFLGDKGDWGVMTMGYHPTPALHDGWNALVIRAQGSAFRIEVNGQKVDDFTDARWPRGRLNLWASRGEARFAHVRITP